MVEDLYTNVDTMMNNRLIGVQDPKLSARTVFSYFLQGKIIDIDTRDFKYCNETFHDLKTMVEQENNGTVLKRDVLPCYDKDNEAYMLHNRHHTCEILYQALFNFYHQPDGSQLQGYTEIEAMDNGSMGGCKYHIAMLIIQRHNGDNHNLD